MIQQVVIRRKRGHFKTKIPLQNPAMLFQRRLIIRASLFLNFCVLTYVALQAAQGGGNGSGGSVNLSGDPAGAQIIYGGETESSASTGGAPGAASAQPPLALPTETDTEVSTSTLEQANWSSDATNEPPPAELRIDCRQTEGGFAYTQRGQFWILNNYVRADKSFRCRQLFCHLLRLPEAPE